MVYKMENDQKEEVQTLTRRELVHKLASELIAFGDDGVIIELAAELGYEVEKKNHHYWTIYE